MGFLKIFGRSSKKKNKPEDTLSPQNSVATTTSNKKGGWLSSSKAKDPRNSTVTSAPQKNSSKNVAQTNGRSSRLASPDEYDTALPRNGSFTNTYTESNSSRERDLEQYRSGNQNGTDFSGIDPRSMTQEQLRIMYEQSRAAARGKVPPSLSDNNIATNGQYDENLARSSSGSMENGSNGVAPSVASPLTTNHLQQWDRQVSGSETSLPGMGGASSKPIYTMSSDLPGQQIQAMDEMNRSDASSSSFNLSTDAEDSEYEMLKRRGRYPGVFGTSTLDTSAIDTATSYTTDEDRKIFPNLPTDDEMTQATEPSLTQPPSLLMPLQTPEDEPGKIHVFPQNREMADDLRAWTLSPNGKGGYREPPTAKSSISRDQNFFASSNNAGVNPINNARNDNISKDNAFASTMISESTSIMNNPSKPTPTTAVATSQMASRNLPGAAPRNFTSPKSQASTNTDFSTKEFGKEFADGFGDFNTDFGDFADFGTFPMADSDWKDGEEKKMQPWEDIKEEEHQQAARSSNSSPAKGSSKQPAEAYPWSNAATTATSSDTSPTKVPISNAETSPKVGTGFSDSFDIAVPTGQVVAASSSFQQDTSLSELLEAAKSKRRTGSRSRSRPSSSSVNSAPAITASFLRQHHNLARYSTGTYQNSSANKDRLNSSGDGTSVSDIIESLEATHTMKRANNVYSHRSVGDTGALATARAAKERLRERRRRERENHSINNNRSTEMSDSEESDHEASDSWLFDEVTGALGPRGIAADLESLSGRSNRSKNSHGNKSHKSSRRKSSRKSSSRRQRSDRSVDSHGSRTSRNSRYSHRSTKSFLSQMSEQSRSVANDLLRLERQLAMVASEENREDQGVRAGSGSASLGGTSRGASRSTSRKTASVGRSSYPTNNLATASAVVRRTKITVMAPPGKLGIILANKADSKGTVVSGVRTSSVLVDRISPGDRIVAIDGEDVSRMTVSEITTIMSRKAEYERRLTVLTIPKTGSGSSPTAATEGVRSPRSGGGSNGGEAFDSSFSSNYRR
ncbi:PDZ domain containing protein [Nitzschia inconspicua]|uniref:PDZ domain containing protein n=1 Tax=Nitzschia inconspicua TaxID=303405 RepID=A0A9K3KKP6_9STRA|nr:PDZ domain containing protein [Nitzschia inconspicua]